MKLIPVKSRAIDAIGYRAADSVLEVRFRNGRLWEYFTVPQAVYEALVSSDSIGHYFSANIQGQYPRRRISER